MAAVRPMAGGVCIPFRYFQSKAVVSGSPTWKSPVQSRGEPGPLVMLTLTVPPGLIIVGAAASDGVLSARAAAPILGSAAGAQPAMSPAVTNMRVLKTRLGAVTTPNMTYLLKPMCAALNRP